MNARSLLYYAALATAVTGVGLVAGSLRPALLEPFVSLVFAGSVALDAPARLLAGVAGALMAGWGLMIALLAARLDALDARAVGTATASGLVAWYVLDGLASVGTGAPLNLVGNTLFLAILLPPALALRRYRDAAGDG